MLSREGKGARKATVPLKIGRQGRQEGRPVVLWGRDFGGSGTGKSRAFGVSWGAAERQYGCSRTGRWWADGRGDRTERWRVAAASRASRRPLPWLWLFPSVGPLEGLSRVRPDAIWSDFCVLHSGSCVDYNIACKKGPGGLDMSRHGRGGGSGRLRMFLGCSQQDLLMD